MLQHRPQQGRSLHLRADLLVAAGRAHDDRRAGTQPEMDGVVGGGVAGMQRDHHVQPCGRVAAHVALVELQAGQPVPGGDPVAQRDHVLAQFDAGDVRLPALANQPLVHRKGQIALARAEVGHMNIGARGQRAALQGRAHHLDEFVDLLPLARHRRHQLALALHVVGHAQVGPVRPVQRQMALLFLVVRGRHGGRPGGGEPAHAQAGLALAAEGQLDLLGAGLQMGVLERLAQQGGDVRQALVQRVVLRHVLGRVAPQERQLALAAQQHLAHRQPLRCFLRADVAGQQQLDEAAIGLRHLQQTGEALQGIGLGGGRRVDQVAEHRGEGSRRRFSLIAADGCVGRQHGQRERVEIRSSAGACPASSRRPCDTRERPVREAERLLS